jgi:hypothetical protein
MVGLGDVLKDLNQYTLRSVHPEVADGAACFSEQWWRELVSGYRFPSACAHVGSCSRVWDLSPAFLALSISLCGGPGLAVEKIKWPRYRSIVAGQGCQDILLLYIDLSCQDTSGAPCQDTSGAPWLGRVGVWTCGVAESRGFFKASRDHYAEQEFIFLLWRSSVATKDFSSLSAHTPWILTYLSAEGRFPFRC